ncbi:hypothetical protein IT072_13950 [Leifsonia sp. ZF2019]|uniref:hypothetical protein n=1 Tax=Leifsonia sp. ZF2019 TaxID=2781978 RepID=UPI001CC04757|nr:hypothetical protein [Leifsonia sp. ZF2019]UAJ78361.1 hypothetical protein IT072_13950 [Leifsonia sp. ZF2019]
MANELHDLSIRITDAVKAELARRDLSGHDLVAPLGLGRNAVYARLRHERPFDTAELEKIVRFLGIDMTILLASADLGAVAA